VTPPERAEVSGPADDIQGRREGVSCCVSGIDKSRAFNGRKLFITADKVIFQDQRDPSPAYRWGHSAWPPQLDGITPDGQVLQGVYVCSGDRLIWAERAKSDGPRPTAFVSEAGSGVRLRVLRRVKE
jgi:hypothetical protein